MDTGFRTPLIAEFLRGDKHGRISLHEPLVYHYHGPKIIVPIGFWCDGASIPRIFWTTVGSPLKGKYRDAAVIHDYCYYKGIFTRKESDKIFLQGMKDLGVGKIRRQAMYRAVRIGGWWSWNNYRKVNE